MEKATEAGVIKTLEIAKRFYEKHKKPTADNGWDEIVSDLSSWSIMYPDGFTTDVIVAMVNKLENEYLGVKK